MNTRRAGRPAIDDTTVAVTIRLPRQYHAELQAMAIASAIRSTPVYCAVMLVSHVNAVLEAQKAQRDDQADEVAR